MEKYLGELLQGSFNSETELIKSFTADASIRPPHLEIKYLTALVSVIINILPNTKTQAMIYKDRLKYNVSL